MKIAGTAIALTNMVVMIGGSVFQPVVGKILDIEWTGVLVHGARVYSSQAYQTALIVLPIGMLLAFLITFLVRETHCSVDHMH